MFSRGFFKVFALICLLLSFTGCLNTEISAIQISPATQSLTVGQAVQFTASGYIGHGTKSASYQDMTSQVTWTSSTPAVATVNSSGLATAVGAGTTTITASMPGATGAKATLTATAVSTGTSAEPVTALSIIPGSQAVATPGETGQFIAIGTSGTTGLQVNLTNSVTWTSSSTGVATIGATGLATAMNHGSTTITAISTNPDKSVVTANATFTVTAATGGGSAPEPLQSLSIIPGSQTVSSANQTSQFIAIGTTSTGATVNLTNRSATIDSATVNAAVWNSSNPAVAAVNSATGVVTALANGTAAIVAVASNPDGTVVTAIATLTVNISSTAEPLISLTIIPASQTALAINQTAQFIAIGTTGAGATKDLTNQANWTSSNTSVATITNTTGLATAHGSGTSAISAIVTNPDGTVVTGTAAFTVTAPGTPEPLVSLSIIPGAQTALAVNQTSQFIAIGTTGTGATLNLTNQATWNSSNTAVATVDATGLATAHGAGSTAITAIATNPDATVVTGTAAFTVTVTSTTEPLVSLSIIPATQTLLAVGQTAQYYAIGTTGTGTTVNLTSQATWSSTNVAVGTMSGTTPGLAAGAGTGTTAITAMVNNPDNTVVTGTAALTVTNPTWVSLAIVPASQTAQSVGETAQFIAIGKTGAGLTEDLTSLATWQSSDASVATVNAAGLATAQNSGTATITAQYKNPDNTVVQGIASYVVTISSTQEPLLSLAIIPVSQSVDTPNETNQFMALATFSGTGAQTNQSICGGTGTIQDCTSHVTWSSSDVKIATIDSTGLATGLNTKGTTAILAIAANPDGTKVTGVGSFAQNLSSTGPVLQSTLTVTLIGSAGAKGLVTAPSPLNPTGPSIINCSATTQTGCVQPFPLATTVTLTAPAPPSGTQFGGWSSTCTPTAAINPTGSNSCTITLGDNSTVAAIFY